MLPDFINPEVLLQGGAGTILAMVVWMVYTGKLVSRRVLDDVRKDRDDRLAEMRGIMSTMQTAYLQSEAARQEQNAQITQLLTLGRIAEALLRALPHPEQNQGQDQVTRELPQ